MKQPGSITDLADALVARLSAPTEKVSAQAVPEPVMAPAHPVAAALKVAAAALRALPQGEVTLADVAARVQKIAVFAQPGTGAQSPGSGAGVGSAQPPPTLPALQTGNLGVTAGGGGAPMTLKSAAETDLGRALRKVAQDLRDGDMPARTEIAQRADHVLNAARGLCYLQAGLRP